MATADEEILAQELETTEDYEACEHLTAEEEERLLADDGSDGVDVKPSVNVDVKPAVVGLAEMEHSSVNGAGRMENGRSTDETTEDVPVKEEPGVVPDVKKDSGSPIEPSLMGFYRGGRPRGGGFGPPFGRGGPFSPRFRPPFGPGPRFRGPPFPNFRGPRPPFDMMDEFGGPEFDDFHPGGPGPMGMRGGYMGSRGRCHPLHMMGGDFPHGPPFFPRPDRFPGPPGRGGFHPRGSTPPSRPGDEPADVQPLPVPAPASSTSATSSSTSSASGTPGNGKTEVRQAQEKALSALAKLRASGDIDPLPVPPDRRAAGIDYLEELPRKGPPPPSRGGGAFSPPFRGRPPLPRGGGPLRGEPLRMSPPLPPRGIRPQLRFPLDRSRSPPPHRRPPMDDGFFRGRPLSPPLHLRRPPTPPVHRYEPIVPVERERAPIPIVRYEDEVQAHPQAPPAPPARPSHKPSHYDSHTDYYNSRPTEGSARVERDPYPLSSSYYNSAPPPPPPPPKTYAHHASATHHYADDDHYRRPRDDYRSPMSHRAPVPAPPPPPAPASALAPRANPNLITLAGGEDESSGEPQRYLKRTADSLAGAPLAKRPFGGPGGPGPLGRTRRIRIENFPPSMNRKLRSMCQVHGGDIERFDMMKTSTGRLVALVQFFIQDSADRFLKTYHKRQIETCVLSVNYVPVVSVE